VTTAQHYFIILEKVAVFSKHWNGLKTKQLKYNVYDITAGLKITNRNMLLSK